MACLLHDIAIAGLLSANHGYWGAQMVAPYVDEEVAWSIEKHEALRYFPDESVGYTYPAGVHRLLRARLPARLSTSAGRPRRRAGIAGI